MPFSAIGAGMTEERPAPTILTAKQHEAPSIFLPANLLREARRQRGLPDENVPAVCALDPDGDIVRGLQAAGAARHPGWACYHTDMYVTEHAGLPIGVVGCAVGAPFAVLVAEQLFVSGCEFLVSITSAGQIAPVGPTPYFVLIDRALRDEGTSYHYLPPSIFAEAASELADRAFAGLASLPIAIHRGTSWTTDAPYRETEDAIAAAHAEGVLAVEMEAAALYAFARARDRPVLCFAHVTNQMARIEGDFEKGEADGTRTSIEVIAASARTCGFGPLDQ
jgi:uridine phosphorylase